MTAIAADFDETGPRLVIPVGGMNCASCTGRVEKAIRAADGVNGVSVNLATHRATIDLVAGARVGPAVEAIRDAGYAPHEETADLIVDNLACASCVGRVERLLDVVPGVLWGTANLATGRAHVRYVGGAETLAALAAALGHAGYPARPIADPGIGDDRDDTARDGERARLKRSAFLAGLATVPLVAIEMGSHLSGAWHHALIGVFGETGLGLVVFVLASLVQFGPGLEFIRKGGPALLRGAPDMNSLVMLGTSAAYLSSVVATFLPQVLPAGRDGTSFEAGAVVVTLVLIGRYLEARAKGRAGDAIRQLTQLQAKTARVVRDGTETDVPIGEVRMGEVVVVRPGERLPVDGIVVSGSSFVDEAMVTGEPAPVRKEADAQVIAGTVNQAGAFQVRATRVGGETLLAQIVRTVEMAQGAKLPVQAMVDKVTLWFVPAILAAALVTFAAWMTFGPAPALPMAVLNAVAVLVIACPCAMGLATPVSVMVGIGRAAQMGVLFRKGGALQTLRQVGVVALDKTGTLTKGRPALTDLDVAEGFAGDDMLRLAASVEARSEHPIAQAIVAEAKRRGLPLAQTDGFRAEPGFGVAAQVDGRAVLVGADRWMARNGIDVAPFSERAERLAADGHSPLYAAVDGRLAAILAVADPLKETSAAALHALKAQGLRLVMVTGDDRRTAETVARRLPLDEVIAEVLPTDKADVVRQLQAGGTCVAFVGDGINDAPALAQADVGLAIGTGTDIAMESADVVLMSGDIVNVSVAVALSRATMRNIAQNLFWAFGYNVLLIPVAAGLLYPAFGILLSPMLAGAAMALSSVSVVANALRLRAFRSPQALRHPDGKRLHLQPVEQGTGR